MSARAGARPAARDLVLLVVATVLLHGAFLGARDLWNPNEPTYGQAVTEMEASGDWAVPTVGGEPFGEKPILYFWLALVFGALTGGLDELTLRLPSALSGVLSTVLVYRLVQAAGGTVRARWAAAVFSTTYIVLWSARQIQMDLLLTLTTLAAVAAAVPVVDRDASPWRGLTLAGFAAGCGALAKGPPGLVLPLLVVVTYAVVSRRGHKLWHPALATGVLTAVAVVLPWCLMLVSRGQADILWEGWVRQTVLRSIAPWDHVAPWWYFLREFWSDMAPWSLFVPLALALPGRDDDARRLDRLAVVWILVVLVVFSIPASKRSPYILPLAPAVAILVSGLVVRLSDGRLEDWRRKATHGVFGALGVLLVTASAVAWLRALPRYDRLGAAGVAAVLLIALGGIVVAGGVAAARRRPAAAAAALIAFVVALDLVASAWVLPAINVYKSPRGFAEAINRHVAADEPVYAYRTWKWRAGYAYYAKRPIPRLTSVEELALYWRRPGPVFLVVERGMLEEARKVLGDATPLVSATIGSNEAHLFGQVDPAP